MRAESDKEVVGRPVRHFRSARRRISGVAETQKGTISRPQLNALGLSAGEIKHLVDSGWLLKKHRGVFAVGYRPLTREGEWHAALLASGPDAVLSHRTAAELWGLLAGDEGATHVTVPATQRRGHRGVVTHRDCLRVDEVTRCGGIPVTTPERTLVDLAGVARPAELERALRQAEYLRLTRAASLAARLDGYRGRRGIRILRRALQHVIDSPGVTRSRLEEKFQRFLREHTLPLPVLNARLEVDGHWFEVDCFWPESKLVVELDGRAAHETSAAFEADRARDSALTAAGLRVLRVTWRRLTTAPTEVARELRAIASRRE